MTRDDIIRMAQEAGFGTLLTGNDLPTMWHGQDLCMLEKFAALVAAEERKSIAIEMQQLRDAAMTAEKWRGIAVARDGDGRTVSTIEREAAAAERKDCADLIAEMRRSIRTVSAVHSAMKDAIDQVEMAVRKRGGV